MGEGDIPLRWLPIQEIVSALSALASDLVVDGLAVVVEVDALVLVFEGEGGVHGPFG